MQTHVISDSKSIIFKAYLRAGAAGRAHIKVSSSDGQTVLCWRVSRFRSTRERPALPLRDAMLEIDPVA